DGVTDQGVCFVLDMTEPKRAEAALAEQAIRDSLTGLYNRRYFDLRIREELARAHRSGQPLALLMCDLDGFKAINDTRGHQFGDEVLKEVASCLGRSVRASDLIFRWGGDEFVVVLSNTKRNGILEATERIRTGVAEVASRRSVRLDVSVGVALYPEHASETNSLVRLADRALYIAKKGGDKVHVGEDEYRLDDQTVNVVFQPVMDVRLNQIVGYEALSRDPQGQRSILGLFKKFQAIGQLRQLKSLCFHLQLKHAARLKLHRVFLNVDFYLLSHEAPPPLPQGREVILEISEGEALNDVDGYLTVAKKWRTEGYKFAVDDFGAGFISLPFIARLIPDYIKLDRSTVLHAVASEHFRRVLDRMLHALHSCSSDGIIAEGIETQKELHVMKGMGLYLFQGYLWGQPQELDRSPAPRNSSAA
ncbi:MAG: diguanylate cyclase, partial [Nitrospirota bacterium]